MVVLREKPLGQEVQAVRLELEQVRQLELQELHWPLEFKKALLKQAVQDIVLTPVVELKLEITHSIQVGGQGSHKKTAVLSA